MYDIFSNPKLKAVMTLYVIMMGFDIVGRLMLPEPSHIPTKVAENSVSGSGSVSDDIPAAQDANGDAIPIDREGFDDVGPTSSRMYMIFREQRVQWCECACVILYRMPV